jgi:hypothetical protein
MSEKRRLPVFYLALGVVLSVPFVVWAARLARERSA